MAAYCCKVRLGENGEVVAYSENADGTITHVVDGVWADYNSDLAFTNRIVVQPLEDSTFRYLSNTIEQKELEVPKDDDFVMCR